MPKLFRRKKTEEKETSSATPMRGRNSGGSATRTPRPNSESTDSNMPKGNALARRVITDDEPATIDLQHPGRFPATSDAPEPETGSGEHLSPSESSPGSSTAASTNLIDDPVSGFLVVIDGPGQGAFVVIRQGVNSVGREADQAIALDFGDEMIASQNHCLVTFDRASVKYYLQQGGNSAPTQVNGVSVVAPALLNSGDRIQLGNTTLLFLPLCSDTFNWDGPG